MTSDNDNPPSHARAETGAAPAAGEPGPADERGLRLREVEAAHIRVVLQRVNWNKREAARVLGISRDTLYRKIVQHHLTAGDSRPVLTATRPR